MILQLHTLRLTALLAFLLGIASIATAQPNGDEFDFDEIPLDEGELPYIGVGGGYTAFLSFMNFDPLNEVTAKLGMEKFGGQLLMHGGGGWTVIGLIPSLRFGVYGAGGSTTKSKSLTFAGTEYNRTVRFDAGFTAAHFDYAIPIFRGFAVVPGFMIGSGSNTFKVVQTQAAGADQENILGGFLGGGDTLVNNNRQATVSRSFLFLYPAVNLEYAVTQFVMLRVGGGYQYTGPGKWLDTEGTEVAGFDAIKSDGPMLQVGLFLGLFQQ